MLQKYWKDWMLLRTSAMLREVIKYWKTCLPSRKITRESRHFDRFCTKKWKQQLKSQKCDLVSDLETAIDWPERDECLSQMQASVFCMNNSAKKTNRFKKEGNWMIQVLTQARDQKLKIARWLIRRNEQIFLHCRAQGLMVFIDTRLHLGRANQGQLRNWLSKILKVRIPYL